MCGILGLVERAKPVDAAMFHAMRDKLTHRGPDDCGSEFFDDDRIALGHRRLSFLDLSAHGRQPLANEDGKVWVVFNGEIYNFVELREELARAGHVFATGTDTEVLVHGYEAWGEGVVDRLKGMFAFALLDLRRNRLFLARDRFGIKPLYWTLQGDRFAFASELKALVACPDLRHSLDIGAVADYLNYRYIPSPKSIWKEIAKLPPAHVLTFDYKRFTVSTREYWRLPFGNRRTPSDQLVRLLDTRLAESVRIHARADVPVGSFLSGGYDSSALVHYLVAAGHRPDTFAIGFEGWEDSEHHHAASVAAALGVPLHHELLKEETLESLGVMPDVYDEPIADISILPTWLVCKLAASRVKAVTSGEGADELLGGYWWQRKIHDLQLPTPTWLERLGLRRNANGIDIVSFYADAMAMGRFDRLEMNRAFSPEHHGALPEDPDWFYRSHFDRRLSPFKAVQRLDIKCFMGELVLVKVDRASMAQSLEVRVPFLDHELYTDLLGVHEDCVMRPGVTKFLLHENLRGKVPDAILARKKQGFVGPEEHYSTFDLYRRGLDDSRLVADGIIRADYIESRFKEEDPWRLWKLLILEQWYKRWV